MYIFDNLFVLISTKERLDFRGRIEVHAISDKFKKRKPEKCGEGLVENDELFRKIRGYHWSFVDSNQNAARQKTKNFLEI